MCSICILSSPPAETGDVPLRSHSLPLASFLSGWVEEKQCWNEPQTERMTRNTAKWPAWRMKAASPKPATPPFLKGTAGVTCPQDGPSKQHPTNTASGVWLAESFLWIRALPFCKLSCFRWNTQAPGRVVVTLDCNNACLGCKPAVLQRLSYVQCLTSQRIWVIIRGSFWWFRRTQGLEPLDLLASHPEFLTGYLCLENLCLFCLTY